MTENRKITICGPDFCREINLTIKKFGLDCWFNLPSEIIARMMVDHLSAMADVFIYKKYSTEINNPLSFASYKDAAIYPPKEKEKP